MVRQGGRLNIFTVDDEMVTTLGRLDDARRFRQAAPVVPDLMDELLAAGVVCGADCLVNGQKGGVAMVST